MKYDIRITVVADKRLNDADLRQFFLDLALADVEDSETVDDTIAYSGDVMKQIHFVKVTDIKETE